MQFSFAQKSRGQFDPLHLSNGDPDIPSRILAITRGVIATSEESSLLIDLFEITFRRFFVSNQRVIISVKACSNLFL